MAPERHSLLAIDHEHRHSNARGLLAVGRRRQPMVRTSQPGPRVLLLHLAVRLSAHSIAHLHSNRAVRYLSSLEQLLFTTVPRRRGRVCSNTATGVRYIVDRDSRTELGLLGSLLSPLLDRGCIVQHDRNQGLHDATSIDELVLSRLDGAHTRHRYVSILQLLRRLS